MLLGGKRYECAAGFSALLQGCWHGGLHATTHAAGWINKVESLTIEDWKCASFTLI